MRLSEDGLTAETETIESDVILPESRVKAAKETGTKSCSGDIQGEWNVDEQDDLLAAVMCGAWENDTVGSGETSHKKLVLGSTMKSFSMLRKYPQTPLEYQLFKGVRIDQLKIDMAVKSFVKLAWTLKGAGATQKVTSLPSPIVAADLKDALTTKAFKTLEGSIYAGDDLSHLEQNRQISNLSVTIANNLEATDALFETEAIEQSFGDFVVSGSFDFWNSGEKARTLYNKGMDGADYVLVTSVSRTENGVKTEYKLTLKVHLDKVSESKDGNKFKNTIEFTMTSVDGIKFEKIVYGTPEAATPTITTDLDSTEEVAEGGDLTLTIAASVTDGGTLSYQWYKGDDAISGATSASYTINDATSADEGNYKCVVTNTLGSDTATATSTVCAVSLSE